MSAVPPMPPGATVAGAPAFNAPFQLLAALPRELWLPAIVCSSGATAGRLDALAHWRDALLGGVLPDAVHALGEPAASAALRQVIGELALTALTHGSEPLACRCCAPRCGTSTRWWTAPPGSPAPRRSPPWRRLFARSGPWSARAGKRCWRCCRRLGDLARLRWDELKGRLNSREWREAQRIGEVLAALPQLAAFIERVGRAQRRDDLPPRQNDTPRAAPPRALAMKAIEIRLVDQPGAVRGIKRSGLISRMLASEAALIRHPVLHRLWRARLAESQLLSYEDEAVLTQWVPSPDERRALAAAPEPAPRGQGPMIVCLDTSGSMRGAPENVAKACVLQALRTAHHARRGCRLLAFGGPDEVVERDLAPDVQGLEALLAVMGQSFDGGTDVQTPLERAISLVHTQALGAGRHPDRERWRVWRDPGHAGGAARVQGRAGSARAWHPDRRPRDHRPAGGLRLDPLGARLAPLRQRCACRVCRRFFAGEQPQHYGAVFPERDPTLAAPPTPRISGCSEGSQGLGQQRQPQGTLALAPAHSAPAHRRAQPGQARDPGARPQQRRRARADRGVFADTGPAAAGSRLAGLGLVHAPGQ